MIGSMLSAVNPFASLPHQGIPSTLTQADIQIEVDDTYTWVDKVRNGLSIPLKLLMWNSTINSGAVSQQTLEKVRAYLHANGLHHVLVSVNTFKPQQVWERTFSNPNISMLSRWTIGPAMTFCEIATCTKLTGYLGDHFNPLSNTVHLFSDDWALALLACARAKDFNSRRNPTLYSMTSWIRYVSSYGYVIQEYVATRNLFRYLRQTQVTSDAVQHAFNVIIPLHAVFSSVVLLKSDGPVAPYVHQIRSVKEYIFAVVMITLVGHMIARTLSAFEFSRRRQDAQVAHRTS